MGVAWIYGVLASTLGIGVGSALAWTMKRIQRGFSFIYAFCTGIIIGLLFLEMIPESIELGGSFVLVIGITLGLLFYIYIHRLMKKIIIITDSYQKDIFVRSGVLLTISIALHNFPVGVSLGLTFGTDIGKYLLTTIILHNIPEGIIIFTPLFLAGFGFITWILFTAFITLPFVIGSIIGQLLNFGISVWLAFIINIAIAIIFVVVVKEIFGEAIRHSSVVYCIGIGIFGFGIIYLYLTFLS